MFDLSIEITTYNRKEVLRDLLERLCAQTHPTSNFEVVLSDDGSNDGLQDMVERLIPTLPYAARLLQHAHQGPGHAHNQGIRACSSELVLMLAADVLPTPMLVAEHLRSHRENPHPRVIVAGKLNQSPSLPDTAFQRATNLQVEKVFASEFDNVEHGGFLVSNLSFKRSFMLEFGMFHEWPPASGEDLELGYRLKKAGMQVIRNDSARSFHHHAETLASVAKRAYMTGYNSHYFAEEVDEPWVRRRFEAAEPVGLWQLGTRLCRTGARNLLINRLTAEAIMMPLIRRAETMPLLAPVASILCKRVTAYYFRCGIDDYRQRKPFVAPQVQA